MHELLKDPLAFALLAQIAMRARWRSAFSVHDLELGEAETGDFESLGMTRAEYRTRPFRLEKWKQITTRATNKGTIAKVISPSCSTSTWRSPAMKIANELARRKPSKENQNAIKYPASDH